MTLSRTLILSGCCAALALAAPPLARAKPAPAASADSRAAALVAKMTRDERLTLVFGYFGTDFPSKNYHAPEEAHQGSAGFVRGIPRLGVPPQWETDAGVGVATQGGAKVKLARTAHPSGMATAASWDPAMGFAGGADRGSVRAVVRLIPACCGLLTREACRANVFSADI